MTPTFPRRFSLLLLGVMVLLATLKGTSVFPPMESMPVSEMHAMHDMTHGMLGMDSMDGMDNVDSMTDHSSCCETDLCQTLCIHAALALPLKVDGTPTFTIRQSAYITEVSEPPSSPPDRIDRPPIV